MNHLFLAGYRGTGKSVVARAMSDRLRMPAVDLDHEICRAADRSIAEIFADGGEAEFRRLESAALQTIAQAPARVVALGGGAVLREENRQVIRQSGRCVLLTASAETIADRIASDAATAAQRPALTGLAPIEETRQLLAARREAYEAVAQSIVDTEGKTVAQIADEIAAWWIPRAASCG